MSNYLTFLLSLTRKGPGSVRRKAEIFELAKERNSMQYIVYRKNKTKTKKQWRAGPVR